MTSSIRPPLTKSTKLNWVWVLLCALLGGAAVFWACSLVWGDSNALPGFWSGVLVNVGTTILLAGVLFWLERRFVKETGQVARAAASSAATQAASQVAVASDEVNKQLSARISDLEERLKAQRGEQTKSDEEAVDILSADASYGSVCRALKAAFDIEAISQYGVTVPAGSEIASPRVNFRYQPAWRNEDGDGRGEGIEVSYVVENLSPNSIGTPFIGVSWAGEDPAGIFNELLERMVRGGFGSDTHRVQIEQAFRNLALALGQAVAARRCEPSAWQSSESLLEIVTKDWVITRSGVEVQGHGVVAKATKFRNGSGLRPEAVGTWTKPEKPDWAQQQEWDVAMERGRSVLGDLTSSGW